MSETAEVLETPDGLYHHSVLARGVAMQPTEPQSWGKRKLGRAPCAFEGCERESRSQGYCDSHYSQLRRRGKLMPLREPTVQGECIFDGCVRPKYGRLGYCNTHNAQWKRTGEVHPIGKYVGKSRDQPRFTRHGYVLVWDHEGHPNGRKDGRVVEHVKVMSEMLGRPLLPGENVHHKNGVRSDNRPENLELWVISQPAGQRPADLLKWAREIIDRYGDLDADRI